MRKIPSRCWLVAVLLLVSMMTSAQLIYPIVGTYKKKGAQGMFIYKDSAFVMNEGGQCRVLDLRKGILTREFMLGSTPFNPHINTVCLGKERCLSTLMPYIYVSETTGQFRCFIEKLVANSSILVQTISAKQNSVPIPVKDWVVDIENKVLYAITRNYGKVNEKKEYCNTIYKMRLPKISEGKYILLEDEDILDTFDVYFDNGMQGAKIRKGKLFIVTGLHEMDQHLKGAKRRLYVINLKKKEIDNVIDLTKVTVNEPEDIDFYKRGILLYCGQNGGIYKLKY